MAKSKEGPALFELIRNRPLDAAEGRQSRSAHPKAEVAAGSAGPPASPPPSPTSSAQPGSQVDEPACEVVRARIRFSLTQSAATVAVGVTVAVLIGAFFLGYGLGEERGREEARAAIQRPIEDEIERARRAAPTQNLFEGIGEDPTRPVAHVDDETTGAAFVPPGETEYAASRVPWVKGYNYIVVQDFKSGARGDAARAASFLEENGVSCAIIELNSAGPYRYRLVTATGFNFDDPVQKSLAEDYRAKVRRIGQAYSDSGGRYDFQSSYFMKLTDDTW
jgi:hypothetical protein